MDPFAVIWVGGVIVVVVAVYLLGKYYPGSGLEQVGLRSAREISETREALEAEDLDQMLASHNARRRARGERELSVSDLEMSVSRDIGDQQRTRERYLADRDLYQLLETTNRRRRARGLPERTLDEVRKEFGGNPPADG